jgi:hypothetical protein
VNAHNVAEIGVDHDAHRFAVAINGVDNIVRSDAGRRRYWREPRRAHDRRYLTSRDPAAAILIPPGLRHCLRRTKRQHNGQRSTFDRQKPLLELNDRRLSTDAIEDAPDSYRC